ncbi:unnamed protein product [Protopolystoma xenopodis]|uniref:Uncharacterized protein n=1 Tax=Protopolystoma xenopodis TaxID=117903 RepID=A0A448WGX4_9PLAT|nr:unnamed protein product [Protopolystoma xenopodis]
MRLESFADSVNAPSRRPVGQLLTSCFFRCYRFHNYPIYYIPYCIFSVRSNRVSTLRTMFSVSKTRSSGYHNGQVPFDQAYRPLLAVPAGLGQTGLRLQSTPNSGRCRLTCPLAHQSGDGGG